MNAKIFRQFTPKSSITGTFFPRADISVLMQDGATSHTARAMLNQIEQTGVKVWTDWPGNSPDLNPIEQAWARLLVSVLKESRPKRIESNSICTSWKNEIQ